MCARINVYVYNRNEENKSFWHISVDSLSVSVLHWYSHYCVYKFNDNLFLYGFATDLKKKGNNQNKSFPCMINEKSKTIFWCGFSFANDLQWKFKSVNKCWNYLCRQKWMNVSYLIDREWKVQFSISLNSILHSPSTKKKSNEIWRETKPNCRFIELLTIF